MAQKWSACTTKNKYENGDTNTTKEEYIRRRKLHNKRLLIETAYQVSVERGKRLPAHEGQSKQKSFANVCADYQETAWLRLTREVSVVSGKTYPKWNECHRQHGILSLAGRKPQAAKAPRKRSLHNKQKRRNICWSKYRHTEKGQALPRKSKKPWFGVAKYMYKKRWKVHDARPRSTRHHRDQS